MPKLATTTLVSTLMKVNARRGLRLRSGPGLEFDASRTLPLGTSVRPLRTVGPWTLVDLQSDGVADGFVSSAFLTDIDSASAAAVEAGNTSTPAPFADATHVPDLIRQGGSAEGLKTARETAASALKGYPKNGCAAHLSALMQQAGMNIEMTFGAGKLAHILAERNWARVGVGQQMPGDVGVCYDNDPSPPGSDHVYLVVSTSGDDLMMVADNQRTSDSPHKRYATGRGKTPTEYFLRAN